MKPHCAKAIVLVGTLLSACHRKEQQRATDLKSVSACMKAQQSHDDYLLATKCLPLGPEAKVKGTWVVGFEISAFRKDYQGVPADLGTGTDNRYELIVPTALGERVHADDAKGPLAFQLSFLGRESALTAMGGAKTIVADKVLSLRRVPLSPS